MRIAIPIIAAAVALPLHAFEIKGVTLGEPMSECPGNSRETIDAVIPGGRSCEWGVKTFGGGDVRAASFTILNGKVASMYIRLERSGRYENQPVRDAMIEKYGQPSSTSKSHLNEYRWSNPGSSLTFDGWKGYIMAMDIDAVREVKGREARALKSDL